MKKSDLFLMALRNLKNRKTRTRLTVIGVVIGTCAIVIMVSIGIGIDKMITSQFESDASLNKISVYQGYDEETGKELMPFDDRAVEYLNGIEHVSAVVPVLNLDGYATVSRGRYNLNWGLKGIDLESMEAMGYTLTEGSFADIDKKNTVFFGEKTVTNFSDSQGNSVKYKYDKDYNISECEIDAMKDAFYISPVINSEDGLPSSQADALSPQRIKVGGIVKEDYKIDYDTGQAVYVDMSVAKELYKQYQKSSTGPKNAFAYSDIYVYVDNMENVKAVKEAIQSKGFSSYSDDEELEYTKKVMMAVQLVLGAIGAVSMFVAAFGISNTMVMAVYERTKEIGIMKVLGCDIGDIKSLFLYEAGTIGFLGGTIGMIISYIVSIAANLVAKAVAGSMGDFDGIKICVSFIPLWLAVSGIFFSVLIGVIAGLSPAKRSVEVSALTAIHNE